MSHEVIISIASNRCQCLKLAAARRQLDRLLYASCYTAELWTEPMGSSHRSGRLYLNQLVKAQYDGSLSELVDSLKLIEVKLGRSEQHRQLGLVDIDLDVLRFGDTRLHLSDWERPYIQNLLEQL